MVKTFTKLKVLFGKENVIISVITENLYINFSVITEKFNIFAEKFKPK
jgi:hypothetical protein